VSRGKAATMQAQNSRDESAKHMTIGFTLAGKWQ